MDLIPKGLDLEYFREEDFPYYEIYLVYKIDNYKKDKTFRDLIDGMVEFFKR